MCFFVITCALLSIKIRFEMSLPKNSESSSASLVSLSISTTEQGPIIECISKNTPTGI